MPRQKIITSTRIIARQHAVNPPARPTNHWNVQEQAEALVRHFIDNRDLAVKRRLGAEYIYKFHHDGPSGNFGGLEISTKQIMPLIKDFETALRGNAPTAIIVQPATILSKMARQSTATAENPPPADSGIDLNRILQQRSATTLLGGAATPSRPAATPATGTTNHDEFLGALYLTMRPRR